MASIAFEEYKNKLNNLRPALDDLGGALHLDEARNEVEKLEEESAQDGFWNDTENSQRVQKRIKTLQHKLDRYAKLSGAWEDMLTMCEMAIEEDDDSMLPDLESEFHSFEETLESMRLETLLTGEDIRSEQRSRNVRNTLSRLLELGALPVINENDAVATDEIGVDNTIGENDSLSAIVAAAIGADLLILLSDIDGLYDSDPHRNPDARLIETVPVIDAHILSLAGDKGSALATGGMVTKLHAAQIATAAGCEMVIANGEKPEVLYDIVAGRRAGTRFLIPHS